MKTFLQLEKVHIDLLYAGRWYLVACIREGETVPFQYHILKGHEIYIQSLGDTNWSFYELPGQEISQE
jgi:hypothetical protein